jgi:hypothetical protein
MVAFEVIALNVLGIASYAAGAYLAVQFVLPRVRTMAAEVLRYPKTTDALFYLLSVLVYLAAAQGIVSRVVAIGIPALNYINVVNPALDILAGIMPFVKLAVIGIGIVLVAERIKLRA